MFRYVVLFVGFLVVCAFALQCCYCDPTHFTKHRVPRSKANLSAISSAHRCSLDARPLLITSSLTLALLTCLESPGCTDRHVTLRNRSFLLSFSNDFHAAVCLLKVFHRIPVRVYRTAWYCLRTHLGAPGDASSWLYLKCDMLWGWPPQPRNPATPDSPLTPALARNRRLCGEQFLNLFVLSLLKFPICSQYASHIHSIAGNPWRGMHALASGTDPCRAAPFSL